jgi:2-dehydropantoate 2-reductase
MKVLVVGAGAVGQVYAAHLKRSGAHVALFVKPPRAEDCKRGLTLYRMHSFRRHVVETFVPDQVVTTAGEVEAEGWDQVWLCVPSTALAGDWLPALLRVIGDATVITTQPGIELEDRLAEVVPRENVVLGVVGMISYQGPLPGEPLDPGVAYLFPPFAKSRFSGHPDRVDPVVAALRRGGCPAKVHADSRSALAFSSSALIPHVVALEGAGWSFEELRHGPWLALASRATREAIRITERQLGVGSPAESLFARPLFVRAALMLAPLLLPFDLEKYLRFHFTKVGDQSRALVRGYTRAAEQTGLDAPALRELEERVFH